ncbi:MAG: DUF4190 domain-containing protein [Oscillospiraceae bacterium]|nr:DUF4190 domain-containing protein [Oscillospiraceae bacterium]
MDQQPIPNPYNAPDSFDGNRDQNNLYYQSRPKQPISFAVAAFILGLVSLIGICCGINVITAPLALICGIIALAKKQGGVGMSLAGVITAGLSLLLSVVLLFSCWDMIEHADEIANDYTHLIVERDEIFPEYEETGELPDFLTKYLESPYSDFFGKYNVNIYDIMDALLVSYKNGSFDELDAYDALFSGMDFSSTSAFP